MVAVIIYSTERMRHLRYFITAFFFIVRTKSNLKCKFYKWKQNAKEYSFRYGGETGWVYFCKEVQYPELFGTIRFYDEENEHDFTFLTNTKHIFALDVTIKKMTRRTVL